MEASGYVATDIGKIINDVASDVAQGLDGTDGETWPPEHIGSDVGRPASDIGSDVEGSAQHR